MLENKDTIDYMYLDENDPKHLIMGIHDSYSWNNVLAHIGALEDKLNVYLFFISNQQWKTLHQEWKIERYTIQIRFLYDTVPRTDEFIKLANVQTRLYNTEIVKIVLSELERNEVMSEANELEE